MRHTLLWIAALTASAVADPLTTIPLFRRSDDSGIIRAAADELDSGVLGGKVLIGTPPQEFTMAFDTNTGFSWVRGSRCKSENCLDRCTYYARRSETVTSTGQKLKVKYGEACVETTIYLDTVEFGGLSVENMPFGGAYRMTGFDAGFDGYLGLGRSVDFNKTHIYSSAAQGLARRDLPASSFVGNAYQQGTGMESAQFGMFTTGSSDNGFGSSGAVTEDDATSDGDATNPSTPPAEDQTSGDSSTSEVTSGGFGFFKRHYDEPAGYLVLGGIDKSAIKGKVAYIDLVDSSSGSANWEVPISLVRFDMDLILQQKKHAKALISTSQNFIYMPYDQADIFHEVFGGKFQESTKTYKVKCSKIKDMPRLKLYLGDWAVEVPAQYWTRVVDAPTDCCATRIARGESDRDWILGTSFTNLFYTTFDPLEEKLGLALKKGQKNDGLKLIDKSQD
ncbi:aspartic peptidase domain-containing protein [Zychaea mexicana]|uniref:aspartic peptidase domain-containing protein n=1 Tax=Zychaea mexicana TaxID=64656 RepID=UPI0022FEC0E7|nr:aspartic peptidase domain-containing protein [Zychaea mexicana]KAI9495736.1 aspartic peptidase domain-containing protein [Zychaea mexicana]